MLSFVGKSFLPEQVANTMTSNPMMTYGTLFGMNIAAGKLINTGAFEVAYNGEQVWSKIETGRFPQMEELRDALLGVMNTAAKPAMAAATGAAMPSSMDADEL